jgi:hypothetical protein
VTGPVWDGQGVDPWLPDRLARDARIAEAERDVYRQLWAELSAWIVKVRRAVQPSETVPPEPMAVWAFVPDWNALVNRFVTGPILDVMGLAFRTIFGDDYEWDHRPGVAAHLASVTNRMVRTPDEVFNMIATAVAEGAGLGEAIPNLAKRVSRILSVTDTEQWPNRAVVVARTETLGALNAGRAEAFTAASEDLGGDFEQMWLATADTRTRKSHRAADGQRVPLGTPFTVGADPGLGLEGVKLMRPGDPTGPAHEVIQCRCTTLLVRPGEDIDLSNRHFTDW